MTKKILITLFAFITFINIGCVQEKNEAQDSSSVKPKIFNGLTKAKQGDLDPGQPMMLNPSETPIYKEDYSSIEESEFMPLMMSGDYIPEPYIDKNKVVRAFVLRKATELEKNQMKEVEKQMANPSNLIGKKAFNFNVTDIYGNEYSLKELSEKVIVMNFWFVECKPCVAEIPELNKLVEKYSRKDVVFLAFATNDKQEVENFIKKQKFIYNIIPSSKNIADLYEVISFPTHIIIDKNSTISYNVIGLSPTTIEDLDKAINLLL